MLHSQIIGEGGAPLIILHGFLGMSDNWRSLGPRCAKAGYEVHLIDQRNHGYSFHSPDFNYSLMVTDLLVYAEGHRLRAFHLMGHSTGGKTAMLFVTEYLHKVLSLIVADISPKFFPPHHQQILQGLASLDFSQVHSHAEADRALTPYVSEPRVRQFLLKSLYWETEDRLGLRLNLPALIEDEDEIGAELPNSNVYEGKTLFLKGKLSGHVMPEDKALVYTHFPHTIIDTISQAGHRLHTQDPTQFHQKTIDFLCDNI